MRLFNPFYALAGRSIVILVVGVLAVSVACGVACRADEYKSGDVWPEIQVVQPGTADGPPSDAVVLFDGKDLSKWEGGEKWVIKDGYATAFGGSITTKAALGSVQFHIEWATPDKIEGSGQGRGNSGVYFMGKYELQILDSHENPTYVDGQAGAIYKQHPPLVNASLKPGQWQTFDVVFNAPVFDKDGKVSKPATMTAFHNGVLIQNHFELTGGTFWDQAPEYQAHAAKLPLHIQYHGNPMRFRNIWYRELAEVTATKPTKVRQAAK